MGKCKFNPDWLKDAKYEDWIVSVKADNNKFSCSLCNQVFIIGLSGVKALDSHMASNKHQKNQLSKCGSKSILSFTTPSVPSTSKSVPSLQSTLVKKIVDNDVLKSEILWAMHITSSHGSARSSDDIGLLFRKMFPDSEIASKFKCSRTKLGYLTAFGIAPAIRDAIMSSVNNAEHYVVMFDESLNPDLQKKQLDVHLRFLDVEGQVKSRYIDSYFLGHAKASDILQQLSIIIEKLGCHKLVQLSMDGPNVNWKVFKDLSSSVQDQTAHTLLNIGSCGLHTLHNSFKDGITESGWDLSNVLKSMYYLFHDSPARRDDFITINESSLLPLKFCGHRWLENVPAAERAISIWPSVVKYVNTIKKGKETEPSCKSFKVIADCVGDKLFLAKLNSFVYVAKILRPFLVKFQRDEPLVPFLCKELFVVVKRLYSLILEPSHLLSISNPSDIPLPKDIDVTHYKPHRKIEVGYQADMCLSKVKESKGVSELRLMEFRMAFQKLVKACISKIVKKSPLKYPFANDLACLDPWLISTDATKAKELFRNTADHMQKCGWIDASNVDDAIFQFDVLEEKIRVRQYLSNERLDEYFFQHGGLHELPELKKIVNIIIILSHGNAQVERGFSVNKEVTVENMLEETLVARRIICQYIEGKCVADVAITREMITACSRAWQRYSDALELKKKAAKSSEEAKKRHRHHEEILDLKSKKRKLELDIDMLLRRADELNENAETARPKAAHEMLVQSNALRRDSKGKKDALNALSSQIDEKEGQFKTQV